MSAIDVTICDVGPRDGLQNDERILAPDVRAELCARLTAAGVPRVEAASFVHPRLVPAMAGAEEVVAALDADAGTTWTGLVLNERGFDRALASGLGHINYTMAVTEAFSERNQGASRQDAEATGHRLTGRARAEGITLTVTLAVSFGCPFEGRVDPAEPLALAARIAASEPAEICFADTIGVAVPTAVSRVFGEAAELGPRIGGHFHDTRSTGIANCMAALDAGCTLLDASVGGTGGCPFAPGATGNVATEDVVYVVDEIGLRSGIDLEAMRETSAWLAEQLGHAVPSAVARAGGFPAATAGRSR